MRWSDIFYILSFLSCCLQFLCTNVPYLLGLNDVIRRLSM